MLEVNSLFSPDADPSPVERSSLTRYPFFFFIDIRTFMIYLKLSALIVKLGRCNKEGEYYRTLVFLHFDVEAFVFILSVQFLAFIVSSMPPNLITGYVHNLNAAFH